MLEGPVFICDAVCMDGCQISSTSKGKSSLSNENAMTDFRQTWYVGSGGLKYYPRGLSSPNAHKLIPHLHISSDWLITKKSNIQSSV